MKIVHWRDGARGVADRYRKQYARYSPEQRFPHGYTVAESQRLLDSLDVETATVADYGHMQPWVEQTCDECGLVFDTLVRIGDVPGYDARWQDICVGCLGNALKLATEAATGSTKP